MTDGYAWLLGASLKFRWTSALVVVLILLSVIIPAGQVTTNMFDEADEDRMMLRYNVEGTYTLEKVREAVDQIEDYLRANQEAFEFESLYSYYNAGRAETTLILADGRTQSKRATA